ncbi:MAG: 5'-methylthioadenosine/adenosylhomocysteine nucleosidase [Campylobacterales bacterium]|nr:5'-methylthioadenosine/adenosylhomocysteine nucleosidase [Campylobacterales bacterium]
MTIGIMGAMVEEIEPILEYYKEYEIVEYASNKFFIVQNEDKKLVIAYSKIGKVFASITAVTMIEKFGSEKILFSGVAGAINEQLKIGDLIVATKLCQHDVDITAFGHPFGYIPEGKVFIEADKGLIEIAKNVSSDLNIELKDGVIATGDQFIADSAKKEWIKNNFHADALEMEGASVAVVCDSLNIPFLILRAISDSADMDASFSFDEFLKTSAKVSAEFIISMVKKL